MDKELFSKENSLYVGIDESKRGDDFEVHSAIFSTPLSKEILFRKFSKPRKSILKLSPELIVGENHYTFSLPPRGYFHRREKESRGVVLASLIKREIPEDLEHLKILLDGKFQNNLKNT